MTAGRHPVTRDGFNAKSDGKDKFPPAESGYAVRSVEWATSLAASSAASRSTSAPRTSV